MIWASDPHLKWQEQWQQSQRLFKEQVIGTHQAHHLWHIRHVQHVTATNMLPPDCGQLLASYFFSSTCLGNLSSEGVSLKYMTGAE